MTLPTPRPRGAVLGLALWLLLALTLLGMVSVRGTLVKNQQLQQQLQSHYRLENAEIALREAEQSLQEGGGVRAEQTIRGAYNRELPAPSYRIEQIDSPPGCPGQTFRILARAESPPPGPITRLQSLYHRPTEQTAMSCRQGRIAWAEIF